MPKQLVTLFMNRPEIFCALDTNLLEKAVSLSCAIGSVTGGIKLGLEFISTFGPEGIEKIQLACPSAALFIDLKFHDIPNTVARAVSAVSERFKPAFLNVHASGGGAMMRAAREACHPATKLLAVTLLTSMDEEELQALGYTAGPVEKVRILAALAQESGLDGVVCSAHEISALRQECGKDFILMVPGIRSAGAPTHDQRRVMTPQKAFQEGASHLVIGRPITDAPDPATAARDILASLR
jgi:orotidine-5'-phosphate decarboxylase